MKTYLVTGVAGFIGFHVTKRLLKDGHRVIGIDNVNNYYDISLKEARLAILSKQNAEIIINEGISRFEMWRTDLVNAQSLRTVFGYHHIDAICHLAAQAGVRYSLENPQAYIDSNITGTLNIFEMARHFNIPKVVYASSSSVYGGNTKIPFSVEDIVEKPISMYAQTKRSNELMAYTYNHLFKINMIGLRFFTVYGPWGRPDMALFIFTKAIQEEKPIEIFNYGKMERDFTYIDDIVDGIVASLNYDASYEIFNLGNSSSVQLEYFVERIEKELNKKAIKNYLPMQAGDVPKTFADIEHSKKCLGFEPKVRIEEGIKRFIDWYKRYHKLV